MMNSAKNVEVADLNQQALVLQGNGKEEKALEYFHKALAIDPRDIDTYINIGNLFASQENYAAAQEYYQKALLVDKHDGRVYFHLGNMYFLQGEYQEGIKQYNTAISEGLDEAIVYFNLGLIYEEQNDVELALRNYSKAIYKNPDAPEFRLKKATLQMGQGMLEESLDILSEMIKLAPDVFEGYHYKFEVLCSLGRFEEAEKVLEIAGNLFPEDVSIFYDKIQLQTRLGNLDKAIEMIQEAEEMEGYEVEQRNLNFEKAKIYGMKEELPRAIEYFEKCKDFEADGVIDFETRYYLMNIYLAQKQYDLLLKNAKEVLEYPEDNPFVRAAFYYRPLALKKLGKKEKATDYYKEAIALFRMKSIQAPTEIDVYFFRALCHKDIGEYDKALELIDFVATLNDHSSEVHVIRSNIYEDMGRKEEAKVEMDLAKELKPDLKLVF